MDERNTEITQTQQPFLEEPVNEKDVELQAMRDRIAELERQNGKKGKLWKKILKALGIIVAFFVIAGLAVFAMSKADKKSPAMAEAVVQAIIAENSDSAYALMYPDLISKTDFAQGFEGLCILWKTAGGSSNYELKQTGWGVHVQNGVKQYTVNYTVTSGNARFELRLVRATQGELSGMLNVNLSVVPSAGGFAKG